MATRVHGTLTAPSVRLQGVSRSFGRRRVLRNIDVEILPGEFVALVGTSGSGKSTLLRIAAGLDPDARGQVDLPRRTAVAYQEHRLLPWKSVWRNVVLGVGGPNRRAAALAALDEVGLSARANAWPLTLSGGEAQRAALARALVRQPDLLLLDEPFAALDALTRRKTQALVARLWTEHRPAVLLVTHDIDEALLLADRVLVIDGGRITREFPVELERPRDPDAMQFISLRRELLRTLGVDLPVGPLTEPSTSSSPLPTQRTEVSNG